MGWKATGETGKGVTVEEGGVLHNGCNGNGLEENVKLQELLNAGRGRGLQRSPALTATVLVSGHFPASQDSFQLCFSTVCFKGLQASGTGGFIQCFLEQERGMRSSLRTDHALPSSSCAQLQNLSHCSSRAACQALPSVQQEHLGSAHHPTLTYIHWFNIGINHTYYTLVGWYQA